MSIADDAVNLKFGIVTVYIAILCVCVCTHLFVKLCVYVCVLFIELCAGERLYVSEV